MAAAAGGSVEQTTDMMDEVRYGHEDDDSDDDGCRTHRYTSFAEMINLIRAALWAAPTILYGMRELLSRLRTEAGHEG